MFIELAETLDCPVCADGYGLVAFVGSADRRRVLEGHLGCPMCEVEFPIAGGEIDFGEPEPEGATAPSDPEVSTMAVKLSALLGLGDPGGMAVLLGRGLGENASAMARMADRVEIISVGMPAVGALPVDDLAEGVDPVRGLGARWPIRSGSLDGIALRGSVDEHLEEAARCLRAERRLVVIEPLPGDAERLAEAGFQTLAGDATAWVGVRS